MPGSSPPPPRTASVLRHDCADGSWHYDWLIASRAPSDRDDRCALTWRLRDRPDAMVPGTHQTGAQLPAHRALYLELRAPTDLGDGRGRVHPVTWGAAEITGEHGKGITVRIDWHDGPARSYRISDGVEDACIECLELESAT